MTLPRTPYFRLEGKRALVTGASSGIGLAAAVALAEAGAGAEISTRPFQLVTGCCRATFSTVLNNRTNTLTTVKHKYVLAGKGYGAMIYLDFSQFVLEYLHD